MEPVPVDYFADTIDTAESLHAQHDFTRSDGEEKLDRQEVDYRQSRILSIKGASGGLEELVGEDGKIDHAEGKHARIFTLTADLKPKPGVTTAKVLTKSLVRGNVEKHVTRQIGISTGVQLALLTIGLTLTWTDFSFPITNGHVWCSAFVLRRLFGNPLAAGYLDKVTIHLFVISWIIYRFCYTGESVFVQLFGVLAACISGAIVSALQAVNLHHGLIFCLLLFCLPGENGDIITVSWWNLPLAVLAAVAVRILSENVELPRIPRRSHIEFESFKVHVAVPICAAVGFVIVTALLTVEGPYRHVVCSAVLGLGYGLGEYVGSLAAQYNNSVSKWPYLLSTMTVFLFSVFSAFFIFKAPFISVAVNYFLEYYQHHDLKWNAYVSLFMSIVLIPRLLWEWRRRHKMELNEQGKPDGTRIVHELARSPSSSKMSARFLYHHVMEVEVTEHFHYLLRLQPSCFLTVVFFIDCADAETEVDVAIRTIEDFLLEIEALSSFKGKIVFAGEPTSGLFKHRLEETCKDFPDIKVQYIWEKERQRMRSLAGALQKCEEKVKVSFQLRQNLGTIEETGKANTVLQTKDFLKVFPDLNGVSKKQFLTTCSELGLLCHIGSGVANSCNWVTLRPWLIWEVLVSLSTFLAPSRRSRNRCCLPERELETRVKAQFQADDSNRLQKILEYWMILSQRVCDSCQTQGYLCVPLLPKKLEAARASHFDVFFFGANGKCTNMTDEYYHILQGLFRYLRDYKPIARELFRNSVSFEENTGAAASQPPVFMFTLSLESLESYKDCIKASIWSREQKIPWDLLDNILTQSNKCLTPKFFCPVEAHEHANNAKGPFVLERGDQQRFKCCGRQCEFPPKSRRFGEEFESLGETAQGRRGEQQMGSLDRAIIPSKTATTEQTTERKHADATTQAADDACLDPPPSYDETRAAAERNTGARHGGMDAQTTAATDDPRPPFSSLASRFDDSIDPSTLTAEPARAGLGRLGLGAAGLEAASDAPPVDPMRVRRREVASMEGRGGEDQTPRRGRDRSPAPVPTEVEQDSGSDEGESQVDRDAAEVFVMADEELCDTITALQGENGSEQHRSLPQPCEQAVDLSRGVLNIGGPSQQPSRDRTDNIVI